VEAVEAGLVVAAAELAVVALVALVAAADLLAARMPALTVDVPDSGCTQPDAL
jgi:hypothetical protein